MDNTQTKLNNSPCMIKQAVKQEQPIPRVDMTPVETGPQTRSLTTKITPLPAALPRVRPEAQQDEDMAQLVAKERARLAVKHK